MSRVRARVLAVAGALFVAGLVSGCGGRQTAAPFRPDAPANEYVDATGRWEIRHSPVMHKITIAPLYTRRTAINGMVEAMLDKLDMAPTQSDTERAISGWLKLNGLSHCDISMSPGSPGEYRYICGR